MTAAAALVAVAVPAAAARGGWRGTAIVACLAVLAGTAASGSPGAGVVLLGFALFAAGLARTLPGPPPAAAALAALLCCGLLILPFLGDIFVEPGAPGRGSPAAVAVLVGGCPLSAAVGGGLGVDLLRTPRAYGGAGGGLSRIGAYYAYAYPRPAAAGAAWGAAGILLLAGAGLARRRRAP